MKTLPSCTETQKIPPDKEPVYEAQLSGLKHWPQSQVTGENLPLLLDHGQVSEHFLPPFPYVEYEVSK